MQNFEHLDGSGQSSDPVWNITAQLVGAYVSHNEINPSEFLDLIGQVLARVERLGKEANSFVARTPAVPIPDSIRDDFLICLEDGRRFKSMKRHLRSRYNLSPQA